MLTMPSMTTLRGTRSRAERRAQRLRLEQGFGGFDLVHGCSVESRAGARPDPQMQRAD